MKQHYFSYWYKIIIWKSCILQNHKEDIVLSENIANKTGRKFSRDRGMYNSSTIRFCIEGISEKNKYCFQSQQYCERIQRITPTKNK